MYPGALLAQECCSYQASTELLARMRGDFVVLVHSDRDCSNVISKRAGRVYPHHPARFLCTNLREDELVTGQGNRRLREALEAIVAAWRPSLILVLSTCPTVMIGDNIRNVARKAGRDLGCRIVAQITHGLKPKSPAEVVDDLYCTLVEPAAPAGDERRGAVNLVGMGLRSHERAEIAEVLAGMGLRLHVVLDDQAPLDDFLAAGGAEANVHPGPNLLLAFDRQASERLGQRAIEVPLPYGLDASLRFYRAIAAQMGVDPARAEAALAGRAAAAAPAVAGFVRRRAGRPLRVAYNIGSVRSFDLRRIGLEELGELPLFRELGFAARLFLQGNQAEDNWDRTARVLGALGVTEHFVLFPDPGALAHFLAPGDFDLWYGARFLRDQLLQVHLPLLSHLELELGLDAVAANIARIDTVLDTTFHTRFVPRVHSPGGVERLQAMLEAGKGVPIPPDAAVGTEGPP